MGEWIIKLREHFLLAVCSESSSSTSPTCRVSLLLRNFLHHIFYAIILCDWLNKFVDEISPPCNCGHGWIRRYDVVFYLWILAFIPINVRWPRDICSISRVSFWWIGQSIGGNARCARSVTNDYFMWSNGFSNLFRTLKKRHFNLLNIYFFLISEWNAVERNIVETSQVQFTANQNCEFKVRRIHGK